MGDASDHPLLRIDEDGVAWIGSRAIRWAQVVKKDTPLPGAHVHRVRRMLVPFENGWCLSVVWGDATYSPNHMIWLNGGEFVEEVTNAEIWPMPPDGVDRPDWMMDPWGWISTTDILQIIGAMMAWPSTAAGEMPVDVNA